jgi:anti-sigma-K factor RskA
MNPNSENPDNKNPDRDVLLEYVMGGLTPEREKEVAAYLRQNPEDAAWVRDMFETVTAVALDQEPAIVPASAENDLLKRIRKESAAKANPVPVRSKRSRFWPLLGLGAALGLVLFFIAQPLLRNPEAALAKRLEQTCAQTGVVCQALVNEANAEIGTLAKRPDNTLLVVFNEAPPQGQVYQGWEIVGDQPSSLGVYDGRVLEITQPLTTGSAFGVTLEPPGGSLQPTTTPIVVYVI